MGTVRRIRIAAVVSAFAGLLAAPDAAAQVGRGGARSGAGAGSAGPDPTQPVVHAGLFRVRQDGSLGGFASWTGRVAGEDLSATVYMLPCSTLGAASASWPVSTGATDVWRLSGRVLSVDDAQASVQLSWERLRQSGKDVSSPPQSVSVVLNRGERTTLETVSLQRVGGCGADSVALSLLFASREDIYPNSSVGGAFGSSAAGRGSANVAGDKSGRTIIESRGGATGARVGSGRGGAGGFGGSGASGAVGSGGSSFRNYQALVELVPTQPMADLWLVHAVPGAGGRTLHARVAQVYQFPRAFTFAPLTIHTPSGVLTVLVQGTVETTLTREGEPRLSFSAQRSVAFAPVGRAARDTPPVTEGSTKTAVPIPTANEVLSFEMPPLKTPGGATLPDLLSIRLRLSAPPAAQTTAPE
jgi:hypothetical protein